jgi:hypothetical protein
MRCYHMPEHFVSDQRPEFLSWLRRRGLPRANPIPPSGLAECGRGVVIRSRGGARPEAQSSESIRLQYAA